MKNTNELQDYEKALFTSDGFISEYYELMGDYQNQQKAYEALERQFFRIFGRRKYKSFESFRQCRNRKLKK